MRAVEERIFPRSKFLQGQPRGDHRSEEWSPRSPMGALPSCREGSTESTLPHADPPPESPWRRLGGADPRHPWSPLEMVSAWTNRTTAPFFTFGGQPNGLGRRAGRGPGQKAIHPPHPEFALPPLPGTHASFFASNTDLAVPGTRTSKLSFHAPAIHPSTGVFPCALAPPQRTAQSEKAPR